MFQEEKLTMLTAGQMFGNGQESQLDVLAKYGTKTAITDLAILTGGYLDDKGDFMAPDDNSLEGRTGSIFTQTSDGQGRIYTAGISGNKEFEYSSNRGCTIRPVLLSNAVLNTTTNIKTGYNQTKEIEYGEYPQYAAGYDIEEKLEEAFSRNALHSTGKSYTFDSAKQNDNSTSFSPVKYDEYEYEGSKYIRVKANSKYNPKSNKTHRIGNLYLFGKNTEERTFMLSDNRLYKNGDYVWIKVKPVKWLIDEKTGILVAKNGLVSGIRFHGDFKADLNNFDSTEIKEYMDKYMSKDLFGNVMLKQSSQVTPDVPNEKDLIRNTDLYELNYQQDDEENTVIRRR